jgi:hypothetical protein
MQRVKHRVTSFMGNGSDILIKLDELIHERIWANCSDLFSAGHFKEAAREAMIQVEKALKEKCPVPTKLYGVGLVRHLLSTEKGMTLRVPFGDDLQDKARLLFEGAFSYYRNYAAHDGTHIDRDICLRVMVLATELMALIGASRVSYTDIGGKEGLVKYGVFDSEQQVVQLLHLLDGYTILDHDPNALYELMFDRGLTMHHLDAILDVGLAEYSSTTVLEDPDTPYACDLEIGTFELTPLGRKVAGCTD